ncbi:hypothetical protein [Clostridium sp. OS1-26]|uniref:hypothetical protein n=1 Tax=Clostridium sp. OS1-26 TaxID=3070681 RepID=UPI0027E0771D|nr:hypothetical protein [Clostridium sp. OS1-26]WML35998.1 hypothetical protein RCG18_04415 [Clostridium sp. OS1-26]
MGKHHRKSSSNTNVPQGFNIGDLLKTIDINQIISIISSLVGANNMTTNQLSSMLRNFDLGDLNRVVNTSNLNENEVKSQLSALADRLDDVDSGRNSNVQDQVLNAVKALQSSPDGQDMLNSLLKGALGNNNDSKKR